MKTLYRSPLWIGVMIILMACGGGNSTPDVNTTDTGNNSGPSFDLNADQQAFAETVFPIVAEHCAGCHSENSNTTIDLARFAHSDSIIAHAVITNRDLVNMSSPENSRFVNRLIEDAHFCWTTCNNDANTIIAAINQWNELISSGIPGGGTDNPPADDPPVDEPPVDDPPIDPPTGALSSVDAFADSVLPLVQQYCANCHNGNLVYTAFAHPDAQTAHDATLDRSLANLTDPDESVLVSYLEDREHNCWSDCATNASRMEGAIAQWQQLITTPADGNNRNPVAVADNYQTPANTTLTTDNVLLNDSDPDSDTLAISAFDAVSTQGGQVQDNVNGTFSYTPPVNFSGTDSFSYTLSDGNGGTASAVVTIIVNANTIPIANDDLIRSDANTSVDITTLLQNDTAPPGRTLSIVSVNSNTEFGGSAILGLNNTVNYTPATGFTGIDSFAYSISDGVTVSNALIRVDINAQPVATSDGMYTYVNLSANTGNVLANDIDTNGPLW